MKYVIKIVRAENDKDLENKLNSKIDEIIQENLKFDVEDIQISITSTTLGIDGAYNLIGCIKVKFKDHYKVHKFL